MFKFIKRIFVTMMFFRCYLSSVNTLECVSMNNRKCKVRPKIVNFNSNEPLFYPFCIKTSKCSGSSNNINDPYAKLCVPDVVKKINIKVFNLMSRTNETTHECKELIDKAVCDKGFIWNPSKCECECDKSCNVGEYLDYSNCKCRKKLVDKLVEECTKSIDEVEIDSENEHKNKCSSCML